MWKSLRIIFTILSALSVAAVMFVGAFAGFYWALIAAGAALLFFGAMLFCKNKQELPEQKKEAEEELKKQFDNMK